MAKIFVAALLILGLGVVGCSKGDTGAAGGTETAAQGGSVGVPECDQYLAKMASCIDKMPAEARGAAKDGLEQSKAAWKQAAGTDVGKQALATSCKSALDALSQNPMCQ